MKKEVQCDRHGLQGIGLVCTHVAHAIDSGTQVGFYWADNKDSARPDAWCQACEKELVALGDAPLNDWFKKAEFKILCASCWDDAKKALYRRK